MRRPVSRLAAANIPPSPADPAPPCGWSMNINAVEPGCTIAALDVHHARVFGRCETKNGIAPFDRLVEQVMTRPPYDEARRVFWIVDNCSAHRGSKAVQRLQTRYPRLVLVHAPLHASWLNQVEIHFSIVQRKVLKPNDFASLESLA